jgi:hypothetical protein
VQAAFTQPLPEAQTVDHTLFCTAPTANDNRSCFLQPIARTIAYVLQDAELMQLSTLVHVVLSSIAYVLSCRALVHALRSDVPILSTQMITVL